MILERLDVHSCEDRLQVALHRARYDFALQHLRSTDIVLEIGTGLGAFTEEICPRITSYTGLEFDEASCRATRQRTGANVVQGDARRLPFSDNQFSYVVCLEVLEHLGNWAAGVREIHRCLQPQGRAIISVPWRRYGGKGSTNEYHLYEPGERELVLLFRYLFEEVEVFYQYFTETPVMTLARKFHLRKVFGLHRLYADLAKGVPEATAQLQISSEANGLKLGLILVASGKNSDITKRSDHYLS